MRKSVAATALAIAGLLLAVVVVAAPSASAATIDTNAWYVLVNRNSGKALDVYNFSTTDGARITQWTRNDGATTSSGSSSTPAAATTGSSPATPARSSTSPTAPPPTARAIVQWADGNGTNQQWRLADSPTATSG